jgi:hypothetical protein
LKQSEEKYAALGTNIKTKLSTYKLETLPINDINTYEQLKIKLLEEVKDNVNSPTHYTTGGIETIDFIEAKSLNYNLGNVVKYVSRSDYKGKKLEDLKKARWYLCREINNLSK